MLGRSLKLSQSTEKDDGDPEIANENRPVSLLPALSKTDLWAGSVESTHWVRNKEELRSELRNGNRKQHSIETLNILTSDLVLEAMDCKEVAALVLLDLSKAFDTDSVQVHIKSLEKPPNGLEAT